MSKEVKAVELERVRASLGRVAALWVLAVSLAAGVVLLWLR